MQNLFLTVAAVLVLSHDGYGDAWPGWRGPTGMGITDAENLPLTWGGENGGISVVIGSGPAFEVTHSEF